MAGSGVAMARIGVKVEADHAIVVGRDGLEVEADLPQQRDIAAKRSQRDAKAARVVSKRRT